MVKVSSEIIQLLKELQGIDIEIMKLEKQKVSLPPEITSLMRGVEVIRRDIEELKSEVKSLSERRRESEQNLDDKLSVLEKLRSQKNLVSTNEAYTALLKEIEAAEEQQNRSEEDILMYMERAEELSDSSGKREAELAASEAELIKLKEKNSARVKSLEGELGILLARRSEKTSLIDSDILPLYESIRKAKAGVAFVPAEKDVCTGCSMKVRSQVISELMKGDVVICDSCSRLLYLAGEES